MIVSQIQIPEAEITDLCRHNGIRKLALFESVLTSRFSDWSDVDVLVEFRPHERVGFFRLADIESELSRLLGGRGSICAHPWISAAISARRSFGARWFCMPSPDAVRLRHMREATVTAFGNGRRA